MNDIIIMFFSAGMICVTVGGIGLYLQTKYRLDDIEKSFRAHNEEITKHKRDIRVLKERDASRSDRVYIYQSQDNDDIIYPHKGGL